MKIELFKDSLRLMLLPFLFFVLGDRREVSGMLAEDEAMAL